MDWLTRIDGICDGLDAGSAEAADDAIEFLEEDPWLFRCGYARATIFRRLKHAELSPEQIGRVHRVLLHHVEVGPRWEFREACTLARRLGSQSLRRELIERVHGSDDGAALRAVTMLGRMEPAWLDDAEKQRGQELLLLQQSRTNWLPRSLRRSAAIVRTPDWPGRLEALVADPVDPRSRAASRLLAALDR